MKLSYLVSPPCKQLSSYFIMASSNVWIPPFNDFDEREFRFILGSVNVNDFINSGVDLYKILPNPDKFYESNPDLLMLSTPISEYYSI